MWESIKIFLFSGKKNHTIYKECLRIFKVKGAMQVTSETITNHYFSSFVSVLFKGVLHFLSIY